jgi:hypothetical protein
MPQNQHSSAMENVAGQVQVAKAKLVAIPNTGFKKAEVPGEMQVAFDEALGTIPKQTVRVTKLNKQLDKNGDPMAKYQLKWPKAGKRTFIDVATAIRLGMTVEQGDEVFWGLSELGHEVDPSAKDGSKSRWII